MTGFWSDIVSARLRSIVPGVLFSLTGALISLAPAAFADEQGWVLTQRSDKVGDQYVYVAPNGVKLVNPKAGYNIVLCAPDWNVCIFNDKTQQYYSASYGEWMKEMDKTIGSGKGSALRGGHWTKSAPSSVCGMRASTYVMQGTGHGHMRNATCWVSDDIVVPTQITDLLAKAYGLPDNKAYPLKVNTVDTSGKLSVQLDTYNSKACAIPSSYFYLPNGYKRVASKEEVMMDDDTKAILRDLASDSPGTTSSSSSSSSSSASQVQNYRQMLNSRPQQTFQQQTFQQQVQSQYQQQPAGASQQQTTQSTTQQNVPPGTVVLPNGQTLDREKVRKIIEVLKNGGKTTP